MFTTFYLLLLLFLVLFSWTASTYGLVLPSGEIMPSLLGADSLRWFVRHSVENIAAAPIVQVILVLVIAGAVQSCGVLSSVWALIRERRRLVLTRRQQYAANIALIVLVICILMLVWGMVSPNGNLLSVTGRIAGGPMASGWLFVLAVIVSLPCLVYGFVSGIWRTERDVLNAFTMKLAHCAGYFVTLIVASQLLAALYYTQLPQLLGWGNAVMMICETVVYGLPLVVAIVRK